MDAPSLLKRDHGQLAALFKEFEGSGSEAKALLAGQICQLLTIHALIEEEILYPAARGVLGAEDEDLVDEATVEHSSIKGLVDQIASADSEDELFSAKVTVLGEYVNHHVQEEENELFPKLQKTQLDLEALGLSLATRKKELMTELGVSADDAVEDDAVEPAEPADEMPANAPPKPQDEQDRRRALGGQDVAASPGVAAGMPKNAQP
jgi:hemerythrin superfamily protein